MSKLDPSITISEDINEDNFYLLFAAATAQSNNIIIEGNLDLVECHNPILIDNIFKNIEGLHINGLFKIHKSNITILPKTLYINDNSTSLSDTKIKKLPKILHIGYDLYYENVPCNIFPHDIKVGHIIVESVGRMKELRYYNPHIADRFTT